MISRIIELLSTIKELAFKKESDSMYDSRAVNPIYKGREDFREEKHTNKVGMNNILKRIVDGKFC